MLSDPKRLKTRNGYGYLVSWKHKLRVESEAAAQDLAKRILADAHNVEQIRTGLGRPSRSCRSGLRRASPPKRLSP